MDGGDPAGPASRLAAFAHSGWGGAPAPGETLVVAVSGGADSVALLDLLHGMGRWRLVVFHLDHQLRPEAHADAEAVRELAAGFGCEPVIERADIAALARAERIGIEECGRRERYARLVALAKRRGAAAILTAHHRDDQVETVLMNLLRGAGETGAAGLPERRDLDGVPLLRPLLPFSREELRGWLRARARTWREDASNDDERFRRNLVRHRVLPLLERAEPGFAAALVRWAEEQQQAETWRPPPGASLALAEIGALARPRRGARWRALLASLSIEPSRERIRRLDELALGAPGRRLHLGGLLFQRGGDVVRWEPARAEGTRARVMLPGPGVFHRGGERIELRDREVPSDARTTTGETWLDAEALRWPLVWRLAEPAERWRPLGASGHQTVRKYLAARGVPARSRAMVAVVADAEGVLWIPGYGVAERARIGEGTVRTVHGRVGPDRARPGNGTA
jgi:tRNA(Ile)-lysidine synthase